MAWIKWLTVIALVAMAIGAGPMVRFQLDDGEAIGIIEHESAGALGGRVWRGRLDGSDAGWFTFVRNGDALAGELASERHGRYLIRGMAGDVFVRRLEGRADFEGCAVTAPATATPRSDAPATFAGGAPIVDVMVVYTPSSRIQLGGTAATEAVIESYFAYTDMLLEDSGVAHRLRLVHAAEVEYVESGNSITDLDRLRDPNDGFMDGVHPLRDTWGADLVALINTSGSAGTAYQMTELTTDFEADAFSAIGADTSPITPGLVFAHETGHNMGCSHNNSANPPDALFCYSYGHRTPDDQWRTIMSSSPGTYVDFFSSPDLTFDGQPLGVPGDGCPNDAADNVRSLNEAAATVAQFRPTVVPITCIGDIGGDGAVGVTDLLALLAEWGGCPEPCPPECDADLVTDCEVNVSDLLQLLASWGPCLK